MFKKKLISFSLIILILIVSIGIVSAEETQILEANSTETLNDEGKTFTDIQMAIDKAIENETVELEGTYKSEGKEIAINKSITITSKNGATLDAQSKSNIFNISNVNICIKNLNLINSQSKTTAAIFNQGNLTIYNSTFTNNTVYNPDKISSFFLDDIKRSAGAIYSTNQLNIFNCEFENNHAEILVKDYEFFDEYLTDLGGSIYSNGTAFINKSKFKENYIESYHNLTIYNSEFITSNIKSYSNAYITNSTFTKTSGDSSVIQSSHDLNLTNCNFTENGGYVIYTESYDENICQIIIGNCNFINNNLKSSGYYDSSFDEFNEEHSTIFSEGSSIYIYNSNFVNNTESAIENHGGNSFIENSNFSKNSAYTGGAINSYNTTIINSTFKENQAKFAGAIYSKILTLNNCNFTNNNEGAIGSEKTAIINGKSYSGLNYFDNSLNKIKLITASVGKLTTTYQSGKTLWVKFIYTETKHPLDHTYMNLNAIKGKKIYYDDVCTNSKGVGYYKASNLPVGTYKITFNYDDENLPKISTTVKITKAKTIIKAPKVTAKYKKTNYFKITIKNKVSKKQVKNTYVKVKIDKKTYKIKTNSKGVAKFNTKKLKIGKHKVVISSGNSNFIMSAKSTIIIKR